MPLTMTQTKKTMAHSNASTPGKAGDMRKMLHQVSEKIAGGVRDNNADSFLAGRPDVELGDKETIEPIPLGVKPRRFLR
jgi:hypothetical protein